MENVDSPIRPTHHSTLYCYIMHVHILYMYILYIQCRSVLEKCPAIPLRDKDRQKEQEGEKSEAVEKFNFDLLPSDLSVS